MSHTALTNSLPIYFKLFGVEVVIERTQYKHKPSFQHVKEGKDHSFLLFGCFEVVVSL